MKKALFLFLIFFLTALFASAGFFYHTISSPNAPESRSVLIRIPPGQSFNATATDLYSKNIIKNRQVFYLLGRFTDKARQVQAGHFEMDVSWSMLRVLDHLTTGSEALYRLRITEGLTWWQIGRLLEEKGIADFQEFKEVIHDEYFLAEHTIFAPSAEGFLYPETYYLSPTRDIGAQRLISIMINQFWASTGDLWLDMEFNEIYQTLNMASLIEKETGTSAEREIISGVFHNRIRKNMLLQCDPTIIYGLGEGFEGRIRRSHLDDPENPYNTYRHRGFPPTPICSPGLASIKAALFPKEHDYLYFVSRNDGTHHFSRTLAEHNRAVNKYQRQR